MDNLTALLRDGHPLQHLPAFSLLNIIDDEATRTIANNILPDYIPENYIKLTHIAEIKAQLIDLLIIRWDNIKHAQECPAEIVEYRRQLQQFRKKILAAASRGGKYCLKLQSAANRPEALYCLYRRVSTLASKSHETIDKVITELSK